MSIEDKLFVLVVTMPIIQNVICFIIGGVIGCLAMAICNAASDFEDPYTDYYEGGEDDGV